MSRQSCRAVYTARVYRPLPPETQNRPSILCSCSRPPYDTADSSRVGLGCPHWSRAPQSVPASATRRSLSCSCRPVSSTRRANPPSPTAARSTHDTLLPASSPVTARPPWRSSPARRGWRSYPPPRAPTPPPLPRGARARRRTAGRRLCLPRWRRRRRSSWCPRWTTS